MQVVDFDKDGEILIKTDSIYQSVKTGYKASQNGLCLFCAGFESREQEGNIEIYYDAPVMQTLKLSRYVRCCEECIQKLRYETPRLA